MTSLADQTILMTGATDGLGRALAEELARGGATVLVHGRDRGRIAAAIDGIHAATGSERLRPYLADFADLAQVRALAEQVIAAEQRLDVLVNNAGIGTTVPGGGARMESADGHELRFAVNYLAGFLLTRLLLPLLRSSAPARIVNVSSLGQQAIDFDDVMLTASYNGVRAYCQSKLAQILFTFDLAGRLAGQDVTVNALHPATYMPTKIVSSPYSTIEEGVAATFRLVAAPELAGVTGRFFNGQHGASPDPQAGDAHARERLRELSEKLTRLPALLP